MIIDCHTHLGRNEHVNANAKQLLESMDSAKIDKALVFACDFNDCPNNHLTSEISGHRDRLLAVAAVHPFKWKKMSDIEREATRLADLYQAGDITAVKFYTGYDHYYPNDHVIEFYLAELESVNCPMIFHMGDCLNSVKHAKLKYAHPLHIDDIAVDYPGSNFIIAHMAYPWHRDAAEVCYKNKNVFADISGFVYGDFDTPDKVKFQNVLNEFLDIADSDRLLFGTDWPISKQRPYIEALEWIQVNTTNRKLSEVFDPRYMTLNVKKAFKL